MLKPKLPQIYSLLLCMLTILYIQFHCSSLTSIYSNHIYECGPYKLDWRNLTWPLSKCPFGLTGIIANYFHHRTLKSIDVHVSWIIITLKQNQEIWSAPSRSVRTASPLMGLMCDVSQDHNQEAKKKKKKSIGYALSFKWLVNTAHCGLPHVF